MSAPSPRFKSIAITGASRGLGAAMAEEFASSGVSLFLSARDMDKLNKVADLCRAKGANVHLTALDVRSKDQSAQWIETINRIAPLDLVIANAGISAGTGGNESGVMSSESPDQVENIFAVNFHGALNTISPAIEAMSKRGKGHIAMTASLAGFRGIAGAPAYCASKAALKTYGEGLRGQLAPAGIDVSVICPGFVETDMTAVNGFKMPFLMKAAKAAKIIRSGLERKKGRIAFPLPMLFGVWLLTTLPDALVHRLTLNAPAKPAQK